MLWFFIHDTQCGTCPWFFCLFPYKPIQIQICTSRQTHDFSAYSRYGIMGNQMCTSWQTHNFSAFSLTNIRIQICTSCQTHDFSSSFYINQYKFKYVLHTKPMIILLISNMYFVSDPWFFCLLPNKSIQIQICTSHQTHDFFADIKSVLRLRPMIFLPSS